MWKKFLFPTSILIPLLGLLSYPPEPMALLYSIFGLVFLFRKSARNLYSRLPGGDSFKLVVLFLLTGVLTESLAWTNNYLKAAEEPALFHPQLIPDLIIGMGFYGGWALAWLIALRWYRFTVPEAFIVTGLQGIFFEQLGAVFLVMLAVFKQNPFASLFVGLYVFAVHGAIVGIALSPVIDEDESAARSGHWTRFPVVIALMVGLAFAGCATVNQVADLFGGLPPKQSIVEHPLW
jgi:hypothetical protein